MARKIMPTAYLLIALLAMLALNFLWPGVEITPAPWNLLGLAPVGFGLWINLAADRVIHQAKTTVKPFEEPSALITHSVYGISRNPMYLGFAAILIGIAILLKTVTPYLIVVIFVFLMDRMFIQIEEQNLARKFGKAWLEYKGKVRRWF